MVSKGKYTSMNRYFKEKNYLHYASCHEDANVVMKYVPNDARFALSIASAGDNSIALLLKDFEKVYVIDNNPTQIYLTKLKAKAIEMLSYEEFLVILGIKKGDAVKIYGKIRKSLEKNVRVYFDEHLFLFKKKLYLTGKFERYLSFFAKYVLPLVNSKKRINKFISFDNLDDQKNFYFTKFNNKGYQKLFKFFFSEKNMKKHGRDQNYFEYVEDNLADFLYHRIESGFCNVLNKDNPYIQIPLKGKFISLPVYLREENFDILKKNIHRLQYIEGDFAIVKNLNLEFDYFNLSDIFEYVPLSIMEEYIKIIYEKANNHARIIFWNMIVKRKITDDRFIKINTESDFIKDEVFYYSNQYVYEVKK